MNELKEKRRRVDAFFLILNHHAARDNISDNMADHDFSIARDETIMRITKKLKS